jgi:hypothetical protein
MAGAPQGEPIICPNGHVGGKLERNVGVNETVNPKDFSLDAAEKHTVDGHYCPNCREPITRYRNGRYQVRTRQGWIGRLD